MRDGRSSPGASSGPSAAVVVRVDAARRSEALGVLLTGRRGLSAGVAAELAEAAGLAANCWEQFWVAESGGKIEAAAMLSPGAGRTAMVFISPLREPQQIAVPARLVAAACGELDPNQVRLVQALLEPGEQMQIAAFEQAGFQRLALLIYMQRRGEPKRIELELDPTIEVVTYSTKSHEVFARAITASYEQTLDCPQLVRLRTIDDVIAGHMAVGRFEPSLWMALHCGGEPVGVMLLNSVGVSASMELVYLGLAPRWRGRGLGRRLLSHGLSLAREHEATTMFLAVDSENEPAMKLYQSMRFVPTTKRVAMIRTVGA